MRRIIRRGILVVGLTVGAFLIAASAQTLPPAPEKSLIEIDASISAIQEIINDLTLKKAQLERTRLARLQANVITEGSRKAVVVRVSGERSVVLLTNGRQREVYLSGVMVKMGRHDEAVTLLNRALAAGVVYPKCEDPECFTVQLFADQSQPSVNCQLIDSGVAIQTEPDLCAASALIADTPDTAIASPDTPVANTGSAGSSTSGHVPGTDVKVRGYYRKDGTYVRPHTRSAPGRRKN